jgi:hypothetical protein
MGVGDCPMAEKDGYDVATALKNVDRVMPKAGEVIRNYIEVLKSRAPQPKDENAETETVARVVVYQGDTGFFDGLTYGSPYEIVGENESQYIVKNDFGARSTIQKTKFEEPPYEV